jgi:hypothetical protein
MSKVIQSTAIRGIANANNARAVGATSTSSSDIDDVVPTRERLIYIRYVKCISSACLIPQHVACYYLDLYTLFTDYSV